MFLNIPAAVGRRMEYLEALDARDRKDGTPRLQRLRQIPPETGKFIALVAAGAPAGVWIEIGASAGYSTLWLALAARQVGRKVVTFEILPAKVALAAETFRLAEVTDVVELVAGDARQYLDRYQAVAFCFLDAEKDVYSECYDQLVPRLTSGGWLVADNVISHQAELQPLVTRAESDSRVDALVVPLGNGELVCRKI